MLGSLKKANETLMKELNDYHRREKNLIKKEAELEKVETDNKNFKDEIERYKIMC